MQDLNSKIVTVTADQSLTQQLQAPVPWHPVFANTSALIIKKMPKQFWQWGNPNKKPSQIGVYYWVYP